MFFLLLVGVRQRSPSITWSVPSSIGRAKMPPSMYSARATSRSISANGHSPAVSHCLGSFAHSSHRWNRSLSSFLFPVCGSSVKPPCTCCSTHRSVSDPMRKSSRSIARTYSRHRMNSHSLA
jgi:hypothetical protein